MWQPKAAPIVIIIFRDFSRFSEDWPGSAVVGFESVTLLLSLQNDQRSVAWLGCVHPLPDFYIRYGAGPCDE